MEQKLGKVEKTVKSPEKLTVQAPLWRDILFNLIPMLILGYMLKSLSMGAGMGAGAANAVFVIVTAGFTWFCVYISRAWKMRAAECCLKVHENGLSGTCLGNAFHSKEFSVPFSELKSVNSRKNRLILITASGQLALFADEPDQLAEELRKKIV